jgi:uncharacterized membrane protein
LGIVFYGYERKYGLDYSIIAHFFNNVAAVFSLPATILVILIGQTDFQKNEEETMDYFMKKIKQQSKKKISHSKKKISQSKKKTSKKI